MELYKYDKEFFDFVDRSSFKSAHSFIPLIYSELIPKSVLDVGCGRGIWLEEWKKQGVTYVTGIDGEYIDLDALHIDKSEFLAKDLKQLFNLDCKYDLVECLEVAEHLPEECSDILVNNLVEHGDIILFSAAQIGQGGENHINEQTVNYWIRKFSSKGYQAFDYPRKKVNGIQNIEPWYRYNTVLYANAEGILRLTDNIRLTKIEEDNSKSYMSLGWMVRCYILARIPKFLVHKLAKIKHRVLNMRYKK